MVSRVTKRPPARVGDVLELVALLYFETQNALGALALARAAAAAPINQSGSFETRMIRRIARATREFLAIKVACMLDRSEPRKACLPQVFELLDDSAVRDAVIATYTSPPRPQREDHMNKAFACWRRVKDDPRREQLRKYRSHTLAHNLIDKTLEDWQDWLLISDPLSYFEEVFGVMDELAWACLSTNRLDEVRIEAQQVANRIWQRLCGP